MSEHADASRPPRRLWQFSLKTLFALMLLAAAFGAGWTAAMIRVQRAEQRARAEARRAHAAERAARMQAERALQAAAVARARATWAGATAAAAANPLTESGSKARGEELAPAPSPAADAPQ